MGGVSVTFRVEFGPHCAVGPGKIALLEHIEASGSLSQAARGLRMSYRRAWLLLQDLNTSFQQPVAHLSVGGRGGGGAALTPFGLRLVKSYRALEARIRASARTAFPIAARAANSARGPGEVARRSINRPAPRARANKK